MLISKHFYSYFILFLMALVATDSVCAPLVAQPASQKKSIKKAFDKKFTEFKQFIRKHQTVFATVGAAGLVLLIAYLAPQQKIDTAPQPKIHQLPPERVPVRPLNRYPVFERQAVVGASPCAVREIVLQPGIQQGNWEHRLVDGNDGRYAWLHQDTGERVFAIQHGREIQEFVSLNGRHRFGPNARGMERLVNQMRIRFGIDAAIPVRQLTVIPQRGNTCAYHALKNCQLILDELENPQGNLPHLLRDPNIVNERIEYWRDHIIQNHPEQCSIHHGNHAGEWLHPDGLQELIDLEGEGNRITVVDAGRFQERLVQDPLALPRPFDFDAQDENFIHGFVVQDRAHWLTAVIRRIRGQIEWFIVDSNNQPAFNRAGIMHLFASLHGRAV